MKSILLIFSLILIVSCAEQKDNENYTFDSESYSENDTHSKKGNPQKTKLYKIKSTQFNMLFGAMPIPSNWEVIDDKKENILFKSSNGVKVYGERGARYFYSNNPEMNYYSKQNGTEIKAPKELKSVINEDIRPFLEANGLKYLGQFPLNQLAQKDEQFDKALFKSMPEQKSHECIATEWEDDKGNKSLGIIRYFKNYYTTMGSMDWGYTLNAIEAPKALYEQAKNDYITALLQLQINPNWLQKNNQYYANQARQSNAQHQQRMAAIRAQGQAAVNAGNTYSSILDSNHESWKRRNGMVDAGHSNTINSGIWERNTMQDQSGNQYQVEGHYDQVWKGTNDNYIGTNNTNWNPNIDNSTNGIDWEQLEHSDDNYY